MIYDQYPDNYSAIQDDNTDNYNILSENPPFSEPPKEFYSIGTDPETGLKDKIIQNHGHDSKQAHFVNELEDFLSNPDQYHQASQQFKNYVRQHTVIPKNTGYFLDGFINSGYIKALESISAPGSDKALCFYEQYARDNGTSLPEAFLFGPNGSARRALSDWKLEEALRGQHRGPQRPKCQEIEKIYDKAFHNTFQIPEYRNEKNQYTQIDLPSEIKNLPKGLEGTLNEVFYRSPQLYCGRWYKGIKRLKGDLPYEILETITIELLKKQGKCDSSYIIPDVSKLEQLIEKANHSGQNPFLSLYHQLDKRTLKKKWKEARGLLNDYAVKLWKERKPLGKIEKQKDFPGTIYLNHGRYYWLPKYGEKVVPLIPEKDKNRIPGGLYKNEPGGYFWWIPRLKFRRRMIPEGEKVATKDLKTAQMLQQKEWESIQENEPQLAKKLKNQRKWGTTTTHKPTAVKIAKKIWDRMQKNDPKTALRIATDHRPDSQKPDMDEVWPSWEEQTIRLKGMDYSPKLPIVYPKQRIHDEWKYGLRVPENLKPIVDKMKTVDWIARDTRLVFDDNKYPATKEMAIQSNGLDWTNEQEDKGTKYNIYGVTSLDYQTGRIQFKVYRPGYHSSETLAEEIYHIVYEMIRQEKPKTFAEIHKWHEKEIKSGIDPTLDLSERFSKAMAQEEMGYKQSLPRSVVKQAQKIFSENNTVSSGTLRNVKNAFL